MSRKLILSPPPPAYSPIYEEIRNREIMRIVNEKVSAEDTTIFGGIPFTDVRGSNANFEIPAGSTPIKLPFDTVVKDTDPAMLFNGATNSMTSQIAMDALFIINLRHAAAPGGSYDFTTQAFLDGVGQQPYTQTISNNQTQDIRVARFVVNYPANVMIDLRAFHSRTGSVFLNMNISAWGVLRMSPIDRVPIT
jgi:hypothetical protein